MEYEVEFRPAAVKDLEGMDPSVGKPVLAKIDVMRHDLAGDVKRLLGDEGYRLRVGDWRVLFDVVGNRILIRRILHRSKAYE